VRLPAFESATAISMFEALVHKDLNGIAMSAYPAKTWVQSIAKAQDTDIPVLTLKVHSDESDATTTVSAHPIYPSPAIVPVHIFTSEATGMMTASSELVRVDNITKRFGGVIALNAELVLRSL